MEQKIKGLNNWIIALSLTAALLLTFLCLGEPIYADETDGISVYLQGEKLSFDVEPVIQNDRVLVPMRAIFEKLGAKVSWDEATKTAFGEKEDLSVALTIYSEDAVANGKTIKLDSVPIIRNNRTLVPLRFISESLGAHVDWNGNTRSVIISMESISPANDNEVKKPETGNKKEENAVWISFLEYMKMPKNEAGFKREFIKMLDESQKIGINSVIAHVRSHSDAMYPSEIYPYSKHLTGIQGKDPGYDPLAFMIAEAHKRGMKFHAWINPYRVSSYGTYFKETATTSPAKRWLSDSDPANDRWVLVHRGDYYLNPSSKQVQEMVISGVMEIVRNYNVDGIHFDDYFYPKLDDSKPELAFDFPEYQLYSGNKSVKAYRQENVNDLVRGVYSAIKEAKPEVRFGISPAGNLANLRSNNAHFVDIDKWLREDGFVDYIMPQLYWGFETKRGGVIAPYAYENNVKSWKKLMKNPNIDLYVGLNIVNAGTDVPDGNIISEWLRNNDVIARQVEVGRQNGVAGFAYFRYEFFDKPQARAEVENLKKTIK